MPARPLNQTARMDCLTFWPMSPPDRQFYSARTGGEGPTGIVHPNLKGLASQKQSTVRERSN
jgi:hypothetical protein